jgi:hypothetical protein
MALACPFCHADLPPTARICRACGLNIAAWLGNNPGASLPGWVGPVAGATARPAHVEPGDDGHPDWSERWPRAGLLFVFSSVQFIMAKFMSDLAAGASGTNAFKNGAYGASALYGALGFCALAGWSMALWLGFYIYIVDSAYNIWAIAAAGGLARIAMTVFSRFVFARLIYRTAKHS